MKVYSAISIALTKEESSWSHICALLHLSTDSFAIINSLQLLSYYSFWYVAVSITHVNNPSAFSCIKDVSHDLWERFNCKINGLWCLQVQIQDQSARDNSKKWLVGAMRADFSQGWVLGDALLYWCHQWRWSKRLLTWFLLWFICLKPVLFWCWKMLHFLLFFPPTVCWKYYLLCLFFLFQLGYVFFFFLRRKQWFICMFRPQVQEMGERHSLCTASSHGCWKLVLGHFPSLAQVSFCIITSRGKSDLLVSSET